MDKFDLIGALKTFAADNNMHFLSGDNFNQNYEASQKTYDDGQFVLTADYNAGVAFSRGGAIGDITYTGILALGRKFEELPATTVSNLDETFIQKYDARLLELMSKICEVIKDFMCEHELEVPLADFRLELNKFDTNIDFVAGNVTFIQ